MVTADTVRARACLAYRSALTALREAVAQRDAYQRRWSWGHVYRAISAWAYLIVGGPRSPPEAFEGLRRSTVPLGRASLFSAKRQSDASHLGCRAARVRSREPLIDRHRTVGGRRHAVGQSAFSQTSDPAQQRIRVASRRSRTRLGSLCPSSVDQCAGLGWCLCRRVARSCGGAKLERRGGCALGSARLRHRAPGRDNTTYRTVSLSPS